MANYIGIAVDTPKHRSEASVAEALKRLPDPWVVLHHVSWQANRNGRQGDGEADFLLLHPSLGAIVLEVKGGDVEVRSGRWRTVDYYGDEHDIQNPYDQAVASKHALVEWLRGHGLQNKIRVGHAVVLPKPTEMPDLGPAATREITWIAGDLRDVEATVQRTVAHWGLSADLDKGELARLVQTLAPTVSIRRRLRDASADAEAAIIQLTATQMKTFAGIRRVRRALILGTAGTGKTVLAVARAQQLAADGFSTLLLCYNELLGDQLSDAMRGAEAITATSFHSFATQTIREAGMPVPATPDQQWWEDGAAKVLVEACARLGREYDAIIIDEAQDFAPEWLSALSCLKHSKVDAPTFLFADPRQDLYGRGWGSGGGSEEWDFVYELPTNMRNTRQIASKVAAAGGFRCDVDSVDGPLPLWRDCHDSRKLRSEALVMVERLIDEGLGPDSLVVLCSSPALAQELRRHVVGPYSLGQWGSRGIPVETIARFKGLEAQAVLIVVDQGQQPEAGRLAYVGMSRARSALAVVAPPSMRKHLGWD